MDYETFLENKIVTIEPNGFEPEGISSMLYPFQRDIVTWACRKGKACIFADCGIGKTPMQLEWSRQVCNHVGSDAKVLIVAPLAVIQCAVKNLHRAEDESRQLTFDDFLSVG